MTRMTENELMIARYLRSRGLQLGEISELMGVPGHQTMSYQFKKLREAWLNSDEGSPSSQAGGDSPLVGLQITPCPQFPECGWCNLAHEEEHGSGADHCCPSFVKVAAYAQMEDLDKHQKIAVLLALLQEVELE